MVLRNRTRVYLSAACTVPSRLSALPNKFMWEVTSAQVRLHNAYAVIDDSRLGILEAQYVLYNSCHLGCSYNHILGGSVNSTSCGSKRYLHRC
jgi:hypothetical protein